jgi:hypothetical protein
MTNPYTRGISWAARLRQLGLTALLLGGATVAAHAQVLNYTVGSATNLTTTYTDLGTTGTAIATANRDDANSTAQNIGFTFSYNGTDFTQFVLNTNGLIRLGAAPPSAANMFANYVAGQQPGIPPIESTRAADTNLLLPFNFDLESGNGAGGAEYRVVTTGTAPNQVCTIQWKNVHDKADSTVAAQYGRFNFQLKLYQTTNVIEFVYDAPTAATTGAEAARYPTVGIKGSGSINGQDVLANKASSSATWDKTVFITGEYAASTHNFRRSVGPNAGRTYRFTPSVVPPDAGVLAVYTLPKLPIPLATPHVVRAAISNNGGSNFTDLVATLTVTGANPFTTTATIPSLPVGQTALVSFPGFSPTVLGNNTLTVSIPSGDNEPTNNSLTTSQQITTNTYSYTLDSQSATSGLGNDTTGALFVGRFSAQASTTVNSVRIFITDYASNTSVGRTVFGVVTDPTTGAILGRSPNYVVTKADANTFKTFPITAVGTTTPLTVPAGDFLAGLGQAAYKGLQFYPIGIQEETPTRPGTFYIEGPKGTTPEDLAPYDFGRFMIEVNAGAAPTCLPPTGATFSAVTGSSVQVTFTGGTAAPAGYTIIYGPVGFDPTTAGTTLSSATLPITISGLTPNATYQLFVRANCTTASQSAFSGPYQFQTGCAPNTTIASFPYLNGFDNILPGQSLPCGFTVLDANNDKATWTINRSAPYSGTNALRYTSTIPTSVAADDWVFTPALTTAANTRYQVAFRYRGEGIANSPSSYTEKLEVKVGPSATPAGQTTTLYSNTAITNTSYALANATSTPAVAVFTPGAGTQYVGFHVFSDANQGNLYIDDLSITAGVVTATSSAALLHAVTVFPNPSTTGLFDLEVHGAQAKGPLGVLVTNALGQQVYTGTARDNYTNRLNLGSLAPGLYYLQVRNGDETMTRQLAIVK